MDSERSADSAGKTPAPMDVTVTFTPSAPGTPRHQSDTVRQQQPPSDPLPSFVGRFEIRALLGSGGFGKVLLASSLALIRAGATRLGTSRGVAIVRSLGAPG